MLLEGRTAMVTGIGPGMGRDIALALAREGADVILVARTHRVMPEVVKEIEALGRRAVGLLGDISDSDSCSVVAEQATAQLAVWSGEGADAGLDILVNSAFHGGKHVAFEDSDLSRWHSPMDVNFFGTLQLTQAVLPLLKAAAGRNGDARIVMINTMSVQRIEQGAGAYAASKAALGAVTKTLALELGGYGIRVNAIHPGYIWGDNVRTYFEWQAAERGPEVTWQDVYDERAAETALGYLPHSSEIAGSVVFFASPLSKCVTGTALPVNAGHWIPPST
ncbi:MAG: SDR family oxidoreductase [Microthrixaceae bacterium]